MGSCFSECISSHLPQFGWLTVGLILAALLGLALATGGLAAAGALGVAAAIGVPVASVVITRLLACLLYCIGDAIVN
jgi:hypothetical protein